MNRETAHLIKHGPKQYYQRTKENKMARNRIRYSWKWKKAEIIIIKANENHKEIKTIREKLINLEDKDYWCFWSGELICAFFFFALLKFFIMKMYYFYKTAKLIF